MLAQGTSSVLWAVLDQVVDDYAPVVEGLERDIEEDHLKLVNEEVAAQRDLLATVLLANMAVISVAQSDVVRRISG